MGRPRRLGLPACERGAGARRAAGACLVIGFTSALAACDSGVLNGGNREPGIRLDGGGGGHSDALPRPDARADGGVSGGDPDAAAPDAAEAPCVCPELPAACTPAAEGVPAFSPSSDEAMQEQLFDLIACADTTLQIAIYETSWDCVVDRLLDKLASDPDLTIELLIDDDRCERAATGLACSLWRLDGQPRVTIRDDARSRYMHHKMAIADGRDAWISSANFTRSSFCTEFNNSLIIRDPVIAGGLLTEFERMWSGELGPIAPRAPIESAPYALYFSPETPVTEGPRWFTDLIAAAETASTSVDFMVLALTRYEIANALAAAHARGIAVRGLVAPEFRDEAAVDALLAAGVPLKIAPVHSKVMIVDGARVITGSPNWSENAWGNNEASLWIADPAIAAEYTAELERIWAGAGAP